MRHFLLILLTLLLAGCRRAVPESVPSRTLFVSIAPQREAVQRIAGDAWDVRVLVPPGASPETFSPDANTLNVLSRARAYLIVKAPMEEALLPKLRALNANLAVIDGTRGMAVESFGEEEGDGDDPHVWLSIPNMRSFAATVADELARLDAAHARGYRERAAEYDGALAQLDADIWTRLAPLKGRIVLVYHPAFGYFLRRYGLRQLSIEREGKEPTGGHLTAVMAAARADGTPALFVQPQFNPKPAQTLARELKCSLVTLDPLPKSYLVDIEELANKIAEAYGLPDTHTP